MKKVYLFFAFASTAYASTAQLTLTGTSYTQNFDGITAAAALPTGWGVYSGASTTFLGTPTTLNTFTTSDPPSMLRPDTSCISNVVIGGFKNFPSADVCHAGDDFCSSSAPIYSNRALGVRQVSPTNASHPNLDSGAAFVLNIANTTGMYNFRLNFNLQSLDSSSARRVQWRIDYAIGSPTSFTKAVATADTFTGGNTFSNNNVFVNFGHSLDNISSPIWIRIATLIYSSGSGNRPSSAIDDYNLTWTSSAATTAVSSLSSQPETELKVIGFPTSDKVTLEYATTESSNYELHVYDFTGRDIYRQNLNAQAGAQQIAVDGLHLKPGMYFARVFNGNSSSVAKILIP